MSVASWEPMVDFRKPMPPLLLAIADKVFEGFLPFRILLMFCSGLAPWQAAQLAL